MNLHICESWWKSSRPSWLFLFIMNSIVSLFKMTNLIFRLWNAWCAQESFRFIRIRCRGCKKAPDKTWWYWQWRQAMSSVDPSMASNETSQAIPLKVISARFLSCSTKSGPPKSGVSQENSFRGTFEPDSIKQVARRDNVRISGVIEVSVEVIRRKVVAAAQKAGVVGAQIYISHLVNCVHKSAQSSYKNFLFQLDEHLEHFQKKKFLFVKAFSALVFSTISTWISTLIFYKFLKEWLIVILS